MSILNVDKIQPIGSGTTVTVNATDTILTNAQAGVITATKFSGPYEGLSVVTDDWITHQGDTNTRMGFPAADTFKVETAGNQRLHITSAGKVGVGIDPTARLHVNGLSSDTAIILARSADSNGNSVINILSEGTTGSSRILFSDTAAATGDAWISYSHNDRAITFTTAGTSNERLRITSAGKVGIGTDSPNEKFEVHNNTGTTLMRASVNSNSRVGVEIAKTGATTQTWRIQDGQSGNGILEFYDQTDSRSVMVLDGAGKVGIGEDVPDLRLHVNGTNALPATSGTTPAGHLILRNKAGNSSHGMYMGVSHAAPWSSWIQAADAGNLATEYPLLLNPNGGGVVIGNPNGATYGDSTLAIEKTSNTIGPRINFYNHAQGQAAATCEIHVGQNYRDANRIIFGREKNNNWQASAAGTASYMGFWTNSAGTIAERMRISSQGYVTTPKNPAFMAHRNGAGSISMASNQQWDVIFPSEEFDNGANYNPSNGRFTAPVAGKYFFGIQLYTGFNGAGVRVSHCSFRKNGNLVGDADLFGGISNHGGTHYHPTAAASIMVDCAVGDYVTFRLGNIAYTGGDTTLYGSKGTRFFGHLVA